MHWFYGILIFQVGVLFLCLFIPVNIHVRYSRNREDDRIYVRISALFLTYTLEIPTVKVIAQVRSGKLLHWRMAGGLQNQEKKPRGITLTLEKIEKMRRIWHTYLENIYNYKVWLRKTLKIFKVEEFHWMTEMGAGDAAMTGTLVGLLWAVKGSVLSLVSYFFTFNAHPRLDVRPRFQEEVFTTHVSCIIRFWLGQAMFAGLRLVFYWLREGHTWRNIRSRV
jgi:hypothetical protein